MNRRQKQVATQIQKDLAQVLCLELRDKRLHWVNITRVEVSGDLRHAKVYFTVLDTQKEEAALQGMQGASAYLRSRLGQCIRLRFVPTLEFYIDEATKKGEQVLKLLDEIRNESFCS